MPSTLSRCAVVVLTIAFTAFTAAAAAFPRHSAATEVLGPFDSFQLAVEDDHMRGATGRSNDMNGFLESAGSDGERYFLKWDEIAAGCGSVTPVERENGDNPCYSWDLVDKVVADSETGTQKSRKLVMSIRGVPCWMFMQPHTGVCEASTPQPWYGYTGTVADRDRFNNELAAFMVAAMRRYDGSSRPFVTNWTVFNEPNNPSFWSEGPPPNVVRTADGSPRNASSGKDRACGYARAYSTVLARLKEPSAGGAPPLRNGRRIALGAFSPGVVNKNVDPSTDAAFTGALWFLDRVMTEQYVPPDPDGDGPVTTTPIPCLSANAPSDIDAVAMNAYGGATNSPFQGQTAEPFLSGRVVATNLQELRIGNRYTPTAAPNTLGGHEVVDGVRKEIHFPDYPFRDGLGHPTLHGMDSPDARFNATRDKPIWITETRFKHATPTGATASTVQGELGQATWLAMMLHKAADPSLKVTFLSWYPMSGEQDEKFFEASGLLDHYDEGNRPWKIARRRKPSFVAYQAPLSIRRLGSRNFHGRTYPVFEVFSYFHASGPFSSAPALPMISTSCKYSIKRPSRPKPGYRHPTTSLEINQWRRIDKSPGLNVEWVGSPASPGVIPSVPAGDQATMRIARIWGNVNTRTASGVRPVILGSGSFCLAQQIPKLRDNTRQARNLAAGVVLQAQKLPATTGPTLRDTWMPNHRTYLAIAGTPKNVGDYRDEPRGKMIVPGPGRVRPNSPTTLLRSFASTFSIANELDEPDEEAGRSFASTFSIANELVEPDEEEGVGLSVTEHVGSEFTHLDYVTSPGEPETEDTMGLPEFVSPKLWFNSRQAAEFSISLDDPTDTWTESYFPRVEAQRWSDGGSNAVGDDAPGRYSSIYDGQEPAQTYQFAANAGVPDDLLVDVVADGEWTSTMPLAFGADVTAPSGGRIMPPRFSRVSEAMIDLDPGVDTESGIEGWRIDRRVRELTDPFVDYRGNYTPRCGRLLSDWQQVGGDNPASPFNDEQLEDDRCYDYRLVAVDNVSNTATFAAPVTLMTDFFAPTAQQFHLDERFVGQTHAFNYATRGYDLGVGNATYRLERQDAPLLPGGCDEFNEYADYSHLLRPNANVNDDGRLYFTDAAFEHARCYRYRYVVTDFAGNSTTIVGGTAKVDLNPPTGSLRITPITDLQHQYLANPNTLYINTKVGGGQFDVAVDNPSALSGIELVRLPFLGAWGNWPDLSSDVRQAPYAHRYTWSTATSGGGTMTTTPVAVASRAQVLDQPERSAYPLARLTTTLNLNLYVDLVGPAGASITARVVGTVAGDQDVVVSMVSGADAGSGRLRSELQRAQATKLANGTCGTYGTYELATANPASVFTDTSVQFGRCYRYRLVEFDRVQNSTTTTAPQDAITMGVDVSTIPQPPGIFAFERFSNEGTATLSVHPGTNPSRAISWTVERRELELRKLNVAFENWTCTRPGPWTLRMTNAPAIIHEAGLAELRCYEYRLRVTYQDGRTVTINAPESVVVDMSPPVGVTLKAGDSWILADPVLVVLATPGADLGVSTASRVLERSSAAYSVDGCGAFGEFETSGPMYGITNRNQYRYRYDDNTIQHAHCYRYRYTVTDEAGNSTTVVGDEVKVDQVKPAGNLKITPGASPQYQHLLSPNALIVNSRLGSGSFDIAVEARALSGIFAVAIPTAGQPFTGNAWRSAPPYTAHYTWVASNQPRSTQVLNTRVMSFSQLTFSTTPGDPYGRFLTTQLPFEIISDIWAPSGASIDVTHIQPAAGPSRSVIEVESGADTSPDGRVASGVASTSIERADAPRQPNGSCGTYTAFAEVARDLTGSFVDGSLLNSRCYRYRVVVRDRVANEAFVEATQVVRTPVVADTTPPTSFDVAVSASPLPALDVDEEPASCVSTPAQPGPTYTVSWSESQDADSGIVAYEVKFDDALLATVAADKNSYAHAPTSTLVEGAHTWQITAIDASGNRRIGSGGLGDIFVVDHTAPDIAITSPAGGVTTGPSVRTSWTATDTRCIALVQIRVDGVVQRTTSAPNGSFDAQFDAGSHLISVSAFDSAGNRGEVTRGITVDGAPPSVGDITVVEIDGGAFQHQVGDAIFYNPAASGRLRVAASALDDTGIATVAFSDIDGASQDGWSDGATYTAGSGTYGHEYSWQLGATSIGHLSIVATDLANRSGAASIDVLADAEPPQSGNISYADGVTRASSIQVDFALGGDNGAGNDPTSLRLERSHAPVTNSQCAEFGPYTLIGGASTPASYADSDAMIDGCYRYRVRHKDAVSNERIDESSSIVLVDRTAPTGSIAVAADSQVVITGTAADAATDVESIEVSFTGPQSGQICQPVDQAWSCPWSVGDLSVGTYTIHSTATDTAGNEHTVSTVYVHSPAVPTQSPSVSLVRASSGIVAKWVPLADATSYRWQCENVTRGTTLAGTTTFVSTSGAIAHTPVCNGNGSNPSGTNIRFTVWPVNQNGEGPASTPQSLTVNARPTVSSLVAPGFNLDNSSNTWKISKAGPATANGSPNHDMYARVQDTDGDLYSLSSPDSDLGAIQDAVAGGDRARFIFRVEPTNATRPQGTSAHLVMQLGPDDGERFVRLVEGVPPSELETMALSGSEDDTCAPGQAKTLTGAHWTLDCSRLVLSRPSSAPTAVDMRIPLRARVGAGGEHLLPDQSYQASGYARDARQPADNRFLTHSSSASTAYPSAVPSTISSAISADRIDPSGEVSPSIAGSNGARKISATINATSTLPSTATNPQSYDASPVASVTVTIDRTSVSPTERLVTNATATCPSAVAPACTYISPVLLPDSAYQVTARITDQAGNVANTAPATITIPPETSTAGGFLNPNFGDAGLAITDIGAGGGDVTHNFLAGNGNIITIGTRIGATRSEIALTSHTPNGMRDAAFGVDGVSITATEALKGDAGAVDDDGRILVAGSAQYGNWIRLKVTRFTTTGVVDSSFGTNGTVAHLVGPGTFPQPIQVRDMIIDDQGRIVIAGTQSIATNEFVLVRLTPNGDLDATFGSNGYVRWLPENHVEHSHTNVAQMPDGKYVLGGNIFSSTRTPGSRYVVVGRFLESGVLDTSFGENGYYIGRPENQGGVARRLIPEADGSITVGLYGDSSGAGLGIARLTPSGQLDAAFGSGDDGATYRRTDTSPSAREFDLIKTHDGKFVAVGQAGNSGSTFDKIAIARFDPNGLVDLTFGNDGINESSTPQGAIRTISAVQLVGGDIVVAGTLIPTSGNRKFLLAGYLN